MMPAGCARGFQWTPEREVSIDFALQLLWLESDEVGGFVPNKDWMSIDERAAGVDARSRFGDRKMDATIGKDGNGAVVALVECTIWLTCWWQHRVQGCCQHVHYRGAFSAEVGEFGEAFEHQAERAQQLLSFLHHVEKCGGGFYVGTAALHGVDDLVAEEG